MAWHRADPVGRRLAQIPSVGPIIATTLVMKTPDPRAFRSGRHFAVWLGLTPRTIPLRARRGLGKITRAGDEDLRRLLVIGATAVIQQAGAAGGRGTRQQGGPHRLEADGDRGKLRRCADQSRSATHRLTQIGRPRRSRPGRPGAATANGAIGRSTMRNNPWDPLAANRPPGCLELASRKPSWPVIKPIAPNRPDIWMHGGRPHMGPAFAGTTAEATPPRSRSPTPCRPGRSAGRYNRSPAP